MNKYLQRCVVLGCGNLTSKKYARQHEGKCKECVTGIVQRGHGRRTEGRTETSWQDYDPRSRGDYDEPEGY